MSVLCGLCQEAGIQAPQRRQDAAGVRQPANKAAAAFLRVGRGLEGAWTLGLHELPGYALLGIAGRAFRETTIARK